jgi:hypothetical protein
MMTQDDPSRGGHLAPFWTLDVLILVVVKEVSPSALKIALHSLGFHWACRQLAMADRLGPGKSNE